MKVHLTLAESASLHPDGTVSMLRAGITRVWSDQVPVLFRGCLVVRITADAAEQGKNDVRIVCINEDGLDRLPPISAQFESARGGGENTLIMEVHTKFASFGLYQFNILVNKVLLDTWDLWVLRPRRSPDATDDQPK